jgi:ATP-dependent DNA helicase PIF1
MTLDTAIVDCKNIFACGQLYVALSRVKNINGLKIINFDKSQILTNPTVKDYYDSLK